MSPAQLDSAIIGAMRTNPGGSITDIRKAVGCTITEMGEAVQRLRFAGKITWGRKFALSPSMQSGSQPPVGNAYGTGDAKEGPGLSPRKRPSPSTLSDEVKAEAEASGRRRTLARKISATAMDPLPQPAESIADRFRRLAREVADEEAEAAAEQDADERRERDLQRLGSPSAVLRRAQRDWPQQCRDVAAIAHELGIGLGECWRRVIMAGVDCLREGGDGEAAA